MVKDMDDTCNIGLENQEYPIPLRIIAACGRHKLKEQILWWTKPRRKKVADGVMDGVQTSPTKGKKSKLGSETQGCEQESELENEVHANVNGNMVGNLTHGCVVEENVNNQAVDDTMLHLEEDVGGIVGDNVSQPAGNSVNNLVGIVNNVVGEYVNPHVIDTMNIREECVNITGKDEVGMEETEDGVVGKKRRKDERKARKEERRARRREQREEEERVHKRMKSKEKRPKRNADKVVEVRTSDTEDVAPDSEREDVIEILKKRRKAGKLKINETRTRVNNKRIPKNVASVSTIGIALNSKAEEPKWRFVNNRRLSLERVLLDVTKRNVVIMNILKEAGILSVIDNVGLYWLKLIREFICNLTRDVNDPESNNYYKVTLRNYMFNCSLDLINEHYGRTNEGDTGDSLLISDIIVSTLTAGSVITWPPKRTHVADVPLQDVSPDEIITGGQIAVVKILQDEIAHLDGMIQSNLVRKSVLEAKVKSLMEANDPSADYIGDIAV
ncbi:hypothetical protein LIER_01337 [Lithospermum erythrorhizon]|uniref:Uncharacterized protein n=1 Tax=Lithospermum erythrorhizon TaxID=34254 RepID=A0AAV3NLA7_LITER